MDQNKLEWFKHTLEEMREKVLAEAKEKLAALPDEEIPHSIDEMDLASISEAQAFRCSLYEHNSYVLHQIQHALERIEEGEFGICEECGEPISIKRLMARPMATLCVLCQEEYERKGKRYNQDMSFIRFFSIQDRS